MLYNMTHRLSKTIAPPSQEDIYNCPHYFSMSYEQVKKSGAPSFLIGLLDQFPFDGRKSILQIRPQDFRTQNTKVDGDFWHADDNVRLLDETGVQRDIYAKDQYDWHLMTISWGAGCQTEFMTTPLEMCSSVLDMRTWSSQLSHHITQPHDSITAPKDQMMEYTSLDIHRADGKWHEEGLRLFIVAFDCSNLENHERILPSIRQLDGK